MNLKKLPIIKIMGSLLLLVISIASYVTFFPIKKGISPDLKYYVKEVKKLSNNNLNGNSLSINFGKQKEKVLATCYFLRNEIIINEKSWNKLTYYGKILLMAHEIAHCKKRVGHMNKLDKWGCADHFMHYSDTGSWCNYYNFKRYVKQMKEI